MDRKSKESSVTQEQIDEFLAKGGTITKCPPGERTEEIEFKGGFYTKRKKQKEEKNANE